jgi:hypothetical protein
MQSPFMHWIDVEQLGDFTKKLFMFLPASICMSTLKDSHSLISQFHIRLYKDHNLLIPFFTTKTVFTFAVWVELVAFFHVLEANLLCEQCNSSFFCTDGN